MPILIASSNGPLCAYLIIKLVRDFKAMNVLATFQNDLRKITDVRAITVIFNVRKKIANFLAIRIKPGTYTLYKITCLAIHVPNLMILF